MHGKFHACASILGVCLLCVGYGALELIMGHPHHAWPWFTAAAPGAGSARLMLAGRRTA